MQREVSLPGFQLDSGNIAHLAPSLLPVLQTMPIRLAPTLPLGQGNRIKDLLYKAPLIS